MRPTILLLLIGGVFLGSGVATTRAGAEPAPLTVAYGNGVHAYFEADYQCSYDALSGVIEAGSNDPRAYYYRGLSALKLGRLDEAEADFQQGANLEAEGRGSVGSRAIGRALERVQGCDRLKLEQYRGRARVAALERDRSATRQRYSDIYESEADVLRRRRPERIEPAEPVAAPRPKVEAEEGGAVEAAEEPAAERADAEADAERPAEPAGTPSDTANPFADGPAAEK
jgi:tetratricopeptide (TPR) repeat protein